MFKKGYLILAIVISLLTISSNAFAQAFNPTQMFIAINVDKKFITTVKEYNSLSSPSRIPSQIPYDDGKGYTGNLKANPGPICTNYGSQTLPSYTCYVTYEGWIYYSY